MSESTSGFSVAADPYNWPFDGSVPPERMAFVVIDMQTDFCGQGGYGIQTAPGLGTSAAALIEGKELPEPVRNLGLTASALAPERLRD